jgi:hypothetical protein
MINTYKYRGIKAAAAATKTACYAAEHVQVEWDTKTDKVSFYTPSVYGYYEPDDERIAVVHAYRPMTMAALKDALYWRAVKLGYIKHEEA